MSANRAQSVIILLFTITVSSWGSGCAADVASDEIQNVEPVPHKTQTPPKAGASDEARWTEEKKDDSIKSVRVAFVTAEPHSAAIEVSGKALAIRESVLSLGVSGLISKIPVKLGDKVKKGQVLLKLDQKGFLLNVRQAEAGLAGANAATDQLTTEIARVEKLLTENAAPSASLDDLNSQNKGAKAKLDMADTSLQQAEKAFKDSVLRAPYNGMITEIYKEEGEQAPTMPATMLMKIVDTSSLEVQVFVPEDASRFVRTGGSADVTVDSAGVTKKGEIVFVSDAISPGARTFETRVRIDNAASLIKAGAFARVRFDQDKVEAILIPISAVKRDDADQPYIFVEKNGRAEKRVVTLGQMDGSRVVAMSGLSAGDRLIVSDTAGIFDGQSVTTEN